MRMMKILTYGICLVLFCLPLYLVRFEIFGIPTTVLEMMIYALFISWLIAGLRITNYRLETTKLFIPIILIFIGVTLATIFSSDLRISAGIWKGWFVDPLLFFLVVVSVVKNYSQIKKIFYSLFLSGTVVAIISLIYLIQGKLDPTGRLQAFYNSPNYLAMYLAPALIIGIGYLYSYFLGESQRGSLRDSASLPRRYVGDRARFDLITRSRIISKTLVLLSVVCLLLSIIFTKSYGAWLGIIAAIGAGIFIYLFKLRKKIAWVVLCLGLVAILALGCFAIIQRPASLEGRLIIWQKALSVYKNNPILGIGPGTFENYLQPHNIFLAFLLQTGIIGFIGFIWLLIYFFRIGFKLQVTSYKLLVISLIVYILVHGLMDTTYWKNDLSVVFWLVVGLMVVLQNRN